MTTNIMEGYLTLDDAATQLGVSKRTLVRWGQLREGPPATRIGRKNFYSVESIRQWLKGRENAHLH